MIFKMIFLALLVTTPNLSVSTTLPTPPIILQDETDSFLEEEIRGKSIGYIDAGDFNNNTRYRVVIAKDEERTKSWSLVIDRGDCGKGKNDKEDCLVIFILQFEKGVLEKILIDEGFWKNGKGNRRLVKFGGGYKESLLLLEKKTRP